MGQHELGPRHLARPAALGRAAAGHPADLRRPGPRHRGHLLGLRGLRPHQLLRPGHRREPAARRPLHQRLHRQPPHPRRATGAVAGLQPRRRPDLDQVRRQPGARPGLTQLPRPQGLLVRRARRRLLGDAGRRGPRPQGRALPQRRPPRLDAPERLRTRQRDRRDLGVPRPVPAAGRRRPRQRQVGHGGQPQPRLGGRRQRRAVLRRRLRRRSPPPPAPSWRTSTTAAGASGRSPTSRATGATDPSGSPRPRAPCPARTRSAASAAPAWSTASTTATGRWARSPRRSSRSRTTS